MACVTRLLVGSCLALVCFSCSKGSSAGSYPPMAIVQPSSAAAKPAVEVPFQAAATPLRSTEAVPASPGSSELATAPAPVAPSKVPSKPVVVLKLEPVTPVGARLRSEGAVAAAVEDEALQTWNYGGRGDPGHISNRVSYHPGTRVVVDASPRWSPRVLRTKGGRIVAQRLLAGLRNRGYWPFRNCFEDMTRLNPDKGGKTHLSVTMSASGKVLGARLLKSTVKNKAVGQCIVRAMGSMRTDRPLGKKLDADVAVSTWPGDLPLLPLPARTTLPKARTLAIDAVLQEKLAGFEACFSEARRIDARLWGRLALAFVINRDGRAEAIEEVDPNFGSSAAVQCVASHLSSITLPAAVPAERLQIGFRLAPTESPESKNSTEDSALPAPDETNDGDTN